MKQKRKIKKPYRFKRRLYILFSLFRLTGPDAGRDSPVVDRFTVGALR